MAVREHPTDTGPADYVLYVNRQAVGVIEAKKDSAGENITVVEAQTERYAAANLKWRKDNTPLRFLFEATGKIIRFTDNAEPRRDLEKSSISSNLKPWQPRNLAQSARNSAAPLGRAHARSARKQLAWLTGQRSHWIGKTPRAGPYGNGCLKFIPLWN